MYGPNNALRSQAYGSKPSRSDKDFSRSYRPSGNGSIRLESGMRIELGSLNGKPLFMTNRPLGGFGWTGTPPVQGPSTGKVSQADIDATRLARSFTRAESEYAFKISTVVNGLYRLTQPTNLPLSARELNNSLREQSINSDVVADALRRLGANVNEVFSVNGQKMHFSGGQFVLVG